MSSSLQGHITEADSGGFRAVASTADMDRDGEIIDAGALTWSTASIPVHADHIASVDTLVARAVPFYDGGRLMIDATFTSTPKAQTVRQMVLDGVLDTVSVMFFNAVRKDVEGVTHITSGELLAVDLVTVPSNRSARVLSVRSYGGSPHPVVAEARRLALRARVELELAEARRVIKSARADEVTRTKSEIRAFLRSL